MKINNPKISVIVPIYNSSLYIYDCINSIINQTLKEIEIILVDDGSKDNSPKIIDEYAKKDKRIIVIHQENGGYGKACNTGIIRAKGEFISIIENDDFIDKKMLEDLYNTSLKINSPIIKCNFYKVTINDVYPMSFENIINASNGKLKIIPKNNIPLMLYESSIWSAIYKRDFILNNNILMLESKGASYQDVIWKFMTYSRAESVYLINKPYYYYRVLSQGSSSSKKYDPLVMFKNYDFIKNDLLRIKKFKEFSKSFYINQALDSAFHCQRLDKENMYIFLNNFGKHIRNNKEFKKIINDKNLSNYFWDHVKLTINNALLLSSKKHKIKSIIKYPIKKIILILKSNKIIIQKFSFLKKKTVSLLNKIINQLNNTPIDSNNLDNRSCDSYTNPLEGIKLNKFNGRKKMLFFAPFTTDGGSRAVLEFLTSIFLDKYEIHLITYNHSKQPTLPLCSFHLHIYPNNNKTDIVKFDKNNKNILDDYKIDEWCGDDLMEEIKKLNNIFNYDLVLVNYVFYSKIFENFNKNTKKILMTHDYFSYRNSRQKKIGINSGFYFSTTPNEEKKGLLRADKILALQNKESNIFKKLINNKKEVITLMMIPQNEVVQKNIPSINQKIKIGYFASDYLNNYYAFKNFYNIFKNSKLSDQFELIIAGGICNVLKTKMKKELKFFTLLGKVDKPKTFYEKIDVAINPDMFISGLKIKNVEAYSFGVPLICTKNSNTGINSKYIFHNCKNVENIIENIKKINSDSNFYINMINASLQNRKIINKKLNRSIANIFDENKN